MNLRTATSLTPREYHARRDSARFAARERRRLALLAELRDTIRHIAPLHPAVRSVHLFGSLLRPGRFHEGSDIDLAVVCDSIEAETPFARALETELGVAIDLRPLRGAVAEAVEEEGETIYG